MAYDQYDLIDTNCFNNVSGLLTKKFLITISKHKECFQELFARTEFMGF